MHLRNDSNVKTTPAYESTLTFLLVKCPLTFPRVTNINILTVLSFLFLVEWFCVSCVKIRKLKCVSAGIVFNPGQAMKDEPLPCQRGCTKGNIIR